MLFAPIKRKVSYRSIPKKNMNYNQAKRKFPKLNPFGDADRDGVMNMFDCRPFNRRKQDEQAEEFIKKRFPEEDDEGYKKEWRERFKSGSPEAHMDSKSRKIYKEMMLRRLK